MARLAAWTSSWTLVLLAACSSSETFVDIGNATLRPIDRSLDLDAEEVDFAADVAIVARTNSGLFTNACQEAEASCEIEVDGDVIVVTAEFERREKSGLRCRNARLASTPIIAECASSPMPAGTYVVHYGTETGELVIPSRIPPLLLGPDLIEE